MAARARKHLKAAPTPESPACLRDGVVAGLGCAKAAWWLLDEMACGGVNVHYGPDDKEGEDVQEWLEIVARRALREGLNDAEEAFNKLVPEGGA